MSTAATIPAAPVSDGDRLSMTMFLATAIHAVVILGVSFGIDFNPSNSLPPTLDIILVQTQSRTAPDDAKHLAQQNQEASGQSDDKAKPTSPVTSPDPSGMGTSMQRQQIMQQQQRSSEKEQRIITAKNADTKQIKNVRTDVEKKQQQISTQEIMQRSLEMARLTSELSREEQRYAQRPRIRYLDAVAARSAVEASYIRSWVEKVERIGNLNYPDEAIRNQLSGVLILSVLMDPSGNVIKISVDKSSGKQVLDDSAIRIVKQSSPFSDFPDDMKRQYDQLMVTRTWVFHSDNSLVTK